MSKKPVDDRRRKLDELKKKQRSSEKRGTIVAILVALAAGGALVAGAVLTSKNEEAPPAADVNTIGVTTEQAGCGEVKAIDEKRVSAQHVPSQVAYPNPPSAGDHNPQTAPGNVRFYSRDNAKAPENLVHNLEHGYVVVWYDDDLPEQEVTQLRSLASSISEDHRKFIVAPWTRGKFEGEANVAMTSWARTKFCNKVSGSAIKAFAEEFDFRGNGNVAPEKNVP